MGNMSYCRMRNTLIDLKDVKDNWHETSSDNELKAREEILKTCREIINWHDTENTLIDNKKFDKLESQQN